MTVIAHGAITDAGGMVLPRRPRVGSKNLFRSAGVTTSVSAALAAAPKELAYNGFTFDAWQSGVSGSGQWIRASFASAQSCDYMAIAAHNLVGATLTPQRSSDGSAWTNIQNGYVAVDNRPIVFEFAAVSFAHYRLLIDAVNPVSLGVINAGVKLTMDRGLPLGWKPPSLNEQKEYTNVMSEGGQVLGRHVIRRGAEAMVDTSIVGFQWARDSWEAFVAEAEAYGFFLWWASTEGRGEIIYGGLESHEAQFSTYTDVTCKFKMKGINR